MLEPGLYPRTRKQPPLLFSSLLFPDPSTYTQLYHPRTKEEELKMAAAAAAMTPPPPTEILHLDTATGYRWILSEAERAHIASLLKTETDAITIRGNIMTQERRVCTHCGKHSGLDDLVHNALALGIHSDDFMLDVLQHGPKNTSPPHNLLCSNCGEQHEGTFMWIPALPW